MNSDEQICLSGQAGCPVLGLLATGSQALGAYLLFVSKIFNIEILHRLQP